MSVGIILLSQGPLAAALQSEAEKILPSAQHVAVIGVTHDEPCSSVRERLKAAITDQNQGQGVLLLADIEGATPCNQAVKLMQQAQPIALRLVCGLNLPMLLKVLSYPRENLESLAQLAVTGGSMGIHPINPE
ncbi:MAG: hypothetical protein MI750_14710 [Xanthomonadales bacterium]|nr:hypothetical protein [Xanthomonadales bacterium]